MTILDPQDYALARRRRRQPSVAVGRPGIRVMRAGKSAIRLAAGIAEHVERVFDDVMPGRSDNMEEKLTGEVAGREPPAHIAAVNRDRGPGFAALLAPFGDFSSRVIEQHQPAAYLLGAVAGPVIRGNKARVQCPGVAKEGKIGCEIERVEIDAAVG
jgi:hypothetical protein